MYSNQCSAQRTPTTRCVPQRLANRRGGSRVTRPTASGASPSAAPNAPISMFKLLSQIRAKDPASLPLSTLMTATNPLFEHTGITFIPPLNAKPQIIAPPLPASTRKLFAAAAPTLPPYFNWFDLDNVAAVKKWPRRTIPYLQPVPDQLSCGSCWAVSSASVLSDRYAIWADATNPVLSPTMVLGCVGSNETAIMPNAGSDGCNGGFPADAATLFGKYGTVPDTCSSYDWCSKSTDCVTGGAYGQVTGDVLNTTIPRCAGQQKSCIQCNGTDCVNVASEPHTLYTAKQDGNSVYAMSISGIPELKMEIFVNGPVVATMAVFNDFMVASVNGFDATSGVYINTPDIDAPYAYGMNSANTQLSGFHAVVIVGWGVEQNVPDWRNWNGNGSRRMLSIPYWIMRNSWSTAWNAGNKVSIYDDADSRKQRTVVMPGYWKHAMTMKLDDGTWINKAVGVDIPSRQPSGQMIGGGTTFSPNVKMVDRTRFAPVPVAPVPVAPVPLAPVPNNLKPCKIGSGVAGGIIVAVVIGFAICATLIFFIVKHTNSD